MSKRDFEDIEDDNAHAAAEALFAYTEANLQTRALVVADVATPVLPVLAEIARNQERWDISRNIYGDLALRLRAIKTRIPAAR